MIITNVLIQPKEGLPFEEIEAEEKAKIKMVFRLVDKNRDGKIDSNELVALLRW